MAEVIKIEIPVTVLDETDALSGIISKLQEAGQGGKNSLQDHGEHREGIRFRAG